MSAISNIPMDATPALNPRSLGQAFKAERMALGLSQQAVAKSAGFRRQTIVDLEAGRNVSMHTLFAAVAALGKGLSIVDARLDLDRIHLLLDKPDADDTHEG